MRFITYPRNGLAGGAAFTARVTTDGRAEILLTGAAYHARDLARGKLSSLAFLVTSAERFRSQYLLPLETPAVMSVNMQAAHG